MADQHDHVEKQQEVASPVEHSTTGVVHGGTAAGLLRMQASAGNQAVISFLNQAQTKLEVGAANDPLEAEADRLADRVVRSLGSSSSEPSGNLAEGVSAVDVRRALEPSEVGPDGGEVEPEVERAIHSARGTGTPLKDGLRQDMEGAFGADLSGVRIHTGSQSDVLNRKLQARAFTVGTDIFFRGSAPDTSTSSGQHLLARVGAHRPAARRAHRATRHSPHGRAEAAVRGHGEHV